jgi:asparagine synthase (glutamine-hydrolysing)
MCGILAVIQTQGSKSPTGLIQAATSIARHRGPDDEGYMLWSPGHRPQVYAGLETSVESRLAHRLSDLPEAGAWRVAFGHRRLSIVDLSPSGHQPMIHEASGLSVVFNGEIYNHIELRRELQRLGHSFKSHSDTEVILVSWLEWGPDCLNRFNGMFAIALLDPREGCIHVARDRFGVKPLYWARMGNLLAFASEIKQIRSLPGFQPRLNKSAVRDYLADGLADHTQYTFDENIRQLVGGERALIRVNGVEPQMEVLRWYELKGEPWRGKDEEAAERFRELLTDSVRLRLRADVPVGSCLSGGLDSSSIACLANRLLGEGGDHAGQITVTACFEDKRFDEWHYAKDVVDQTGARPVRVWPSFERLEDDVDRFLWHLDEPCGSTSMFSQWCVFGGAAGVGLKVMLDGQGSDEQLAGYSGGTPIALLTGIIGRGAFFSLAGEIIRMRRAQGRFPATTVALALRNVFPAMNHFLPARHRNGRATPNWLRMDAPPLAETEPPHDLSDALRRQTLSTSLPALLRYEDRNSMAWSIESRVPFLDYRLVEFVAGLPDHLKLRGATTKVVLREAMRGGIPESVRQRRDKMGFVTPEEEWVRTAGRWFRRSVETAVNIFPGFFEPMLVNKMFEDVLSGRSPFTFALWRIACLGRWASVQRMTVSPLVSKENMG